MPIASFLGELNIKEDIGMLHYVKYFTGICHSNLLRRGNYLFIKILIASILLLVLAACSQPEASPTPTEIPRPSSTPSSTVTNTPTPRPTATPTTVPSPTPPSAEAILSEAWQSAGNAGTTIFELDGSSQISFPGFTLDIPMVSRGEAQWPDSFHQVVTMTVTNETTWFEEIRHQGKYFWKYEPLNEYEEISSKSYTSDFSGFLDSGISNPITFFELLQEELQLLQRKGTESYQEETVYRLQGKLAPKALSPIYLAEEPDLLVTILVGVEDHLIREAIIEGEIDGNRTTLFPGEDLSDVKIDINYKANYLDYGEPVTIEVPQAKSVVFVYSIPMGEVTYSPDGAFVAAITADPGVVLWTGDPADLQEPFALAQYRQYSGAVAISPDSKSAATFGDNLLTIWSLADGPTRIKTTVVNDELYELAFSPIGDILAGAGLNGSIYLWETDDYAAEEIHLEGGQDTIYSLRFSGDGQQLASAGEDGSIFVWDMNSMGLPNILVAEGPTIYSLAFHPQEPLLVLADETGAITQYDLTDVSTEPTSIGRHRGAALALDYSSDGRYLVSSDFNGVVRLWEITEFIIRQVDLPGYEINVNGVRFSPDDRFIVATAEDGNLRYWYLDQFLPDLAEGTVVINSSGECQDPLGCVVVPPTEPLWLASALVLSGPNAELGLDSQRGVELALDFQESVLEHPLALQTEDDGCNIAGGQRAAINIVNNPDIIAVVGTSCSGAAVPAAEIVSSAGYVMVSPSNTSPALTDPERSFREGYLRTAHNDELQAVGLAHFVFDELGVRSAATVHDGDPYTEGLATTFGDVFENLGGEIVATERISPNANNVEANLARIAAADPELIYFPVFIPLGSLITNTARDMDGYDDIILVSSDGLQSPSFLDNTVGSSEGLLVTGPDLRFASDFYLNEFLPAYQEKYGEEPTAPFHAHAFDATIMILQAIEETAEIQSDGTLVIGRQALRDALYATSGFPGITGTINCDEFGDCAATRIAVSEVVGNKFVPIWP